MRRVPQTQDSMRQDHSVQVVPAQGLCSTLSQREPCYWSGDAIRPGCYRTPP